MSWSGVKKQTNIENIKSWCDEMGIKDYTINFKGEIDVDGNVSLSGIRDFDFEELPYKFGKVTGYFSLDDCKNLISLKNCPDYVKMSFYCNKCTNLVSLEGCPKEVGGTFSIRGSKKNFSKKYIGKICNVSRLIVV